MDMKFHGKDFLVMPGVIKPFDSGSFQVDFIKSLKIEKPYILDVGSGTGNLGIACLLEIPDSKCAFIEKSGDAVENTNLNIEKYKLEERSTVVWGDFRSTPIMSKGDIIIVNLNFLPDGKPINTDDPPTAIYGGQSGMELYQEFWLTLTKRKSSVKWVSTQCLVEQFPKMDTFAHHANYQLRDRKGYASLYEKRTT